MYFTILTPPLVGGHDNMLYWIYLNYVFLRPGMICQNLPKNMLGKPTQESGGLRLPWGIRKRLLQKGTSDERPISGDEVAEHRSTVIFGHQFAKNFPQFNLECLTTIEAWRHEEVKHLEVKVHLVGQNWLILALGGEGAPSRKASRWWRVHHFQRWAFHLRHRSETQRSDSRRFFGKSHFRWTGYDRMLS